VNDQFSRGEFIRKGIQDLFSQSFNMAFQSKDERQNADRTSGAKVLNYMQNTNISAEDKDWLRTQAELVGSHTGTAIMGFPMPSAGLNLITQRKGAYYGQNLGGLRDPGNFITSNRRWNVADPPNLLGVYVGKVDPKNTNLEETPFRPSGGYPYSKSGRAETVYDVSKYVRFLGFSGDGAQDMARRIVDMRPGEIVNLNRKDIEIDHYSSIDLGDKSNWSVGKGEDGVPYVALADKWDFGGGILGPVGDMMEEIGAREINFYGRMPIPQDFLNYDWSMDN
jgi:cation transport regulator ChaB